MVLRTASPSLRVSRIILPRYVSSCTRVRPDSSWISRNAACSRVSPGSIWPLGKTQILLSRRRWARAILSCPSISRTIIAPADMATFWVILPLTFALPNGTSRFKGLLSVLSEITVGGQGQKFDKLVICNNLIQDLRGLAEFAPGQLFSTERGCHFLQ